MDNKSGHRIMGISVFPSFLNASTYMISSASEAMEFAKSLATSFGNLGVTIETTIGGLVIVRYGVEYAPWLTLAFGVLAIMMIILRWKLEKKGYR